MKLLRFFAAIVCCALAPHGFALPQDDAARPKRPRLEMEVAERMLMHSVQPEYPKDALADHVSGTVFLNIVIDQQGKVTEAEPVPRDEWPPNWPFTEDSRLRDAVIQAVKQWEFKPYLLNGQPVEAETKVAFKFKTEPPYSTEGRLSGSVMGGIAGNTARPPDPALLQPQKVSSEVMEANLLKRVEPEYPRMAWNARIQGVVRLQAVVSKTGVITKLHAISGHPILIQAALDAVKQWEYKPFLVDGEPVEAEGEVIVAFKR